MAHYCFPGQSFKFPTLVSLEREAKLPFQNSMCPGVPGIQNHIVSTPCLLTTGATYHYSTLFISMLSSARAVPFSGMSFVSSMPIVLILKVWSSCHLFCEIFPDPSKILSSSGIPQKFIYMDNTVMVDTD